MSSENLQSSKYSKLYSLATNVPLNQLFKMFTKNCVHPNSKTETLSMESSRQTSRVPSSKAKRRRRR